MELFAKLVWSVYLVQVVKSEMCVSTFWKVFPGSRLQGIAKVDFVVETEVQCVIRCVDEEICHSSNLIKRGEQLYCELYDVDFNDENMLKDENATVYSIIDDKVAGNPKSKVTTESVQTASLSKIGSTLSTTIGYTPSVLMSSTITQDKSTILPSRSQISTFSTSVPVPSNSPAVACKRIYEDDKSSVDKAYTVFPGSEHEARVFCDMTGDQTGCGGKGWTLVMKTDGREENFKYSSHLWTNKKAYQPTNGKTLDNKQTKLSTYWSTPFTKICLGMLHNNKTFWMIIDMESSSLYNLISNDTYHATTLEVSSWQNLIKGSSSLQEKCPLQGINVQRGDTGARIGIIATKTCKVDGDYNSRLGFGMKGNSCGQDGTNTCGNDARCNAKPKDLSIKTFGYIFVK